MKRKLMKLYKEWCETGEIPENGLYNSVEKVSWSLRWEFDNIFCPNNGVTFWGYGGKSKKWNTMARTFTPLRQTLMLLLIQIIDDEK